MGEKGVYYCSWYLQNVLVICRQIPKISAISLKVGALARKKRV